MIRRDNGGKRGLDHRISRRQCARLTALIGRERQLATIRKRSGSPTARPKTAWICDYADQHGTRRLKRSRPGNKPTPGSSRRAIRWRPAPIPPNRTSATLGEALELWLQRAVAEGLEPRRLSSTASIAPISSPLIVAETKLAKITTGSRRAAARRSAAPTPADGGQGAGDFKSALKDAERRGLVAQNVAAGTAIQRRSATSRKLEVGVDVPTPDEVKA